MRAMILILFLFSIVGTWAHASSDVDQIVGRMLNEIESEYFDSGDESLSDAPIAKIDSYYEENPVSEMDLDEEGQIQVKKKMKKLAKKSKVKKLQANKTAMMELSYTNPVWSLDSQEDGEEFSITGMTDRVRKRMDQFSRLSKQRCSVKGRFDGSGVYITSLKNCKSLAVADNDIEF